MLLATLSWNRKNREGRPLAFRAYVVVLHEVITLHFAVLRAVRATGRYGVQIKTRRSSMLFAEKEGAVWVFEFYEKPATLLVLAMGERDASTLLFLLVKIKLHMDTLTPAERSRQMSLIRGKNTKPELTVRRILSAMGYKYRLHYRSLPGCPDIVFPGRKKAVFVHGCFWHGHYCRRKRLPKSRVAFWRGKIERNAARDIVNRRRLTKAGWSSIVVWECGLKNAKLADKLKKFLGPR